MSNDIPIPGQKVVGPYLNELRDQVARLLHIRHNRFPGAQPVSFTQDNVNDLLNRNFFVCEKTDGLRIMLFATYNRQEKKYESFLINRSHDFYYTKVLLPVPPEPGVKPYTKFHHGTLIDGELIVDTEPDGRQVMRYLVFDCLTCRDKVLIARPFRIRLGHFHDFVLKPLKRMASERPDLMQRIPFQIEAKQMQLSYHVKEIFAEQPMLKHKSDGLIFTSSEEPYTLGTDQNILKWKPANENTVDFLLRHNSRGEMELHLWHGGNRHEFHCLLHEHDPNKLSMLRGANGKIIECHYEPGSNPPWQFMRFRSDKNTANHYSVFEKIMQSIRDGVTQEHLESIAPSSSHKLEVPRIQPTPRPSPTTTATTDTLARSCSIPTARLDSSVPPSMSRTLSAPHPYLRIRPLALVEPPHARLFAAAPVSNCIGVAAILEPRHAGLGCAAPMGRAVTCAVWRCRACT
ncbi:mRNA capping enzyme, catalytic domain-domain-containing protein [Catenaria anguillulae PL171]|uniref:mRNA guanylyltransferase n=1 Tax=Catenaria anguillulae PL171 TaxID=765915 RepID=A0A1Y2HVV7_9FUNG|nr:mRNA capping enzyme, catalytic domain-domain-containing protein [Catenaria anguillulae PL171]